MRAPILTVMLTTILACAEPPASTPPAASPVVDERVAAAQAFQRDYDESLRADEVSFLTTIGARYLGEGDRLVIEVGGMTRVVIAEHDDLKVVNEGDVHVVTDAEVVPLDEGGRWRLGISRQESDWRVLIHDRDAEARRGFTGIAWFPIDPNLIVDARFEPAAIREPRQLQTSRGVTKTLYLAGVYRFELEGQSLALEVFGYDPEPRDAEPLLIPFRDATNSVTSYGAGRYLEPIAGDTVLDFNRATNPLCAYSEHYNCPMPPAFNRLGLAIPAGARAPEHPH